MSILANAQLFRPEPKTTEPNNALALILFSVLIMLAYVAFKNVVYFSVHKYGINSLILLSAIVSFCGSSLKYRDLPKSYRIIIRVIDSVSLFYAFFG